MENVSQQTLMDVDDSINFSDYEIDVDTNISLDNYEIVSPEFFAQVKEPSFTINVNKITTNAACVRMMPNVDYVKILLNAEEKKLVLKPCDETDLSGYRWVRVKNGRRYASYRTGEYFVLIMCKLMGWNPDFRYKILGKRTKGNGEDVFVFDLTVAQVFKKPAPGEKSTHTRRAVLPSDWNGSFGPKYGESHRTLQVDTFAGYTVFSIKGEAVEVIDDSRQELQDSKKELPEITEETLLPDVVGSEYGLEASWKDRN